MIVDFGNTLRTLRVQYDYTQEQLAERLGVTKSMISAYENGFRMPSYQNLVQIARIFRVSTDYLLGVESRTSVDFSGLTDEEAAAIISLIRAIKHHHSVPWKEKEEL